MHIQCRLRAAPEYVFLYRRTCIKYSRRYTCKYMRENVIIRECILPNTVGGRVDSLWRSVLSTWTHNIVAYVCHANVRSAEWLRYHCTITFGIYIYISIYIMPRTYTLRCIRIFVHFSNRQAFFFTYPAPFPGSLISETAPPRITTFHPRKSGLSLRKTNNITPS